MCDYVCIFVCMCMYVYVCVCMSMYVYACLCMSMSCLCLCLGMKLLSGVKSGSQLMDRPLVTSAATGSISSVLLWLVKETFAPSTAIPVPSTPHLPFDLDCPTKWGSPPLTFWTGLILGFLLWPIIELAMLIKQWLVLAIRSRIELLGQRAKLYRVLG